MNPLEMNKKKRGRPKRNPTNKKTISTTKKTATATTRQTRASAALRRDAPPVSEDHHVDLPPAAPRKDLRNVQAIRGGDISEMEKEIGFRDASSSIPEGRIPRNRKRNVSLQAKRPGRDADNSKRQKLLKRNRKSKPSEVNWRAESLSGGEEEDRRPSKRQFEEAVSEERLQAGPSRSTERRSSGYREDECGRSIVHSEEDDVGREQRLATSTTMERHDSGGQVRNVRNNERVLNIVNVQRQRRSGRDFECRENHCSNSYQLNEFDRIARDSENNDDRARLTRFPVIERQQSPINYIARERENAPSNSKNRTVHFHGLEGAVNSNEQNEIESYESRAITNERVLRHVITRRNSCSLPKFDGNPTLWIRFKRAFELVSKDYSDGELVEQIYNALEGVAKDAVQALMVTDCNARRVIDLLDRRFGDPVVVAGSLASDLRRLPRLGTSGMNLVAFASKVETGVEAIEAIGERYERARGFLQSAELAQEIMSKLPESLVDSFDTYFEQVSTSTPMLVAIARFLARRAELSCRSGSRTLHELRNPTRVVRESRVRGHTVYATVANTVRYDNVEAYTGTKQSNRDRSRSPINKERQESLCRGNNFREQTQEQCSFCNREGHPIGTCRGFKKLEIAKRWNWIKDQNRCFNCLGLGHRVKSCQRQDKCLIKGCRSFHHSSLHRSWENKERNGGFGSRMFSAGNENWEQSNGEVESIRERQRNAIARKVRHPVDPLQTGNDLHAS